LFRRVEIGGGTRNFRQRRTIRSVGFPAHARKVEARVYRTVWPQ
jgi:hypothetical protein